MSYTPRFDVFDEWGRLSKPLYEPGVSYKPGPPVPTACAGMIPAGKQGSGWPDTWEDCPVWDFDHRPDFNCHQLRNLSFSPDPHLYHMTVVHPDGRIDDPSIPLGMEAGYKRDYVMTKELEFTVSTPEQLSEYWGTGMADLAIADGTMVRVTSLDCVFVLDKSSRVLADGVTVIRTRASDMDPSYGGRWIREPADSRPLLTPMAAAIYESYMKSDQPQLRRTNITGAYSIVAPRGVLIGVSGPGSVKFIKRAMLGTKGRGSSTLVVPSIIPAPSDGVKDELSAIGCADLTVSSNVPNLWDFLQENKTVNLAIVDCDINRIGNIALTSRIRGLRELRVAFVHHTGRQYLEQHVDIDIRCCGLVWAYNKHRYAKECVNGVYSPI